MPNPNPNTIHPIPNLGTLINIKPTINNPNIIVGDFSYFSDSNFEQQVLHHYPFLGDKLIVGKFCQIAKGVQFIMNGANHQLNSVSTYPFYIFEDWGAIPPPLSNLPIKGDTVVGNDVWIGQNATILAGVHLGDGAIVAYGSVVTTNVQPYTIVAGNPARVVRQRFNDKLITLLLQLQWWDKPIDEIKKLLPLLSNPNLEEVERTIEALLY